MSASDWSLLTGDRGINLPRNYDVDRLEHRSSGRRSSSPSATRSSSPCCSSAWVSVSPSWCRRAGAGSAPAHGVPAARWRSGSRRHRCCSGASTRPASDPLNPILQDVGLIDEPDPVLRHAHERAPVDGVPDRVEVRRPVHAHPARRAPGDPARALRGRRPSTVPAAGRRSGSITLPLLRPSLALALILCVTGSLLAFDQFYILTKGGPDNSTVTIV